jgi:hypothetical protein
MQRTSDHQVRGHRAGVNEIKAAAKMMLHPVCLAAVMVVVLALAFILLTVGQIVFIVTLISSIAGWIFGYNWAKRH